MYLSEIYELNYIGQICNWDPQNPRFENPVYAKSLTANPPKNKNCSLGAKSNTHLVKINVLKQQGRKCIELFL